MTKKNRVATTASVGQAKPADPSNVELDEAEPGTNETKEGQNVGEVRRKVEKMTYEEEAGGRNGVSPPNGATDSTIPNNNRIPSAPEDEGTVNADDGDDSGEWEKIDAAEIEAATAGDGLKRKAVEPSESSSTAGGDHIQVEGVKRQKETPSVCLQYSCCLG